jgi:hypothetical protein
VFVTVNVDEKGSLGSIGSETATVTRGRKVTPAAKPPNNVHTATSAAQSHCGKRIYSRIRGGFFFAFFDLASFTPEFDIAAFPLN